MSTTDELRAMAESVGLEIPKVATLMMEAADTIDRLDAENDKLRELAKDLHALAGSALPERKSDYITICSVESCINYYSRTMPAIEHRMRELRVEVDG